MLVARLTGVVEKALKSAGMTIIFKVGLHMFVDTKAINLSGGNKRKLCLGMALLGRPKILFIDEASAGVDPASRRVMWNAIQDEGRDSAVVITTHAMEEAEALSDRIGIMVQGTFKCFGALKEIQEEYGLGFEVEFNMKIDSLFNEVPEVKEASRYADNE